MLRIYLEEVAKSATIFAATKPICSKRYELSRQPLCQRFRQSLHVIGCGDERSRCIFQRLSYKRNLRRLPWMEHVPAFAVVGVAIEFFITGDAPNICRHAI